VDGQSRCIRVVKCQQFLGLFKKNRPARRLIAWRIPKGATHVWGAERTGHTGARQEPRTELVDPSPSLRACFFNRPHKDPFNSLLLRKRGCSEGQIHTMGKGTLRNSRQSIAITPPILYDFHEGPMVKTRRIFSDIFPAHQ